MALYTPVCEGHRRGPSRGAFAPGSTSSASPVGLGVARERIAGSGEDVDDGRGNVGIVDIACGAAVAASAHGTAFDMLVGGSEDMEESWSALGLVPVPGHGCELEPGPEAELGPGRLVHEREPAFAVAAFGEKAAGSGSAMVTAPVAGTDCAFGPAVETESGSASATAPVAEAGYASELAVEAASEAAAVSGV